MTKTFKGESSESAQARAKAFILNNASIKHWEVNTEKVGREYISTLTYSESSDKNKYAENEEIIK